MYARFPRPLHQYARSQLSYSMPGSATRDTGHKACQARITKRATTHKFDSTDAQNHRSTMSKVAVPRLRYFTLACAGARRPPPASSPVFGDFVRFALDSLREKLSLLCR